MQKKNKMGNSAKSRWDCLSLRDKSDLMRIYIRNGITSLEEMRGHYNGMYAEGGDISPVGRVTPYGQWWYPGEVTTIPGNDITMKGVNYPVLGVSNKGDRKLMMPGRDYKFRGDYVTEYPMFGNGGHLFQDKGQMTRWQSPFLPPMREKKPVPKIDMSKLILSRNYPQDKTRVAMPIPFNPDFSQNTMNWLRINDNLNNNQVKHTYINRLYENTWEDKKAFVKQSFDDWYYTAINNGCEREEAIRLAKWGALQDALESSYGSDKKAFKGNNWGGLGGKKFIYFDNPETYYNTKFGYYKTRWPKVLDPATVEIEDFVNALNENPVYQYAPENENENYVGRLKGMKSAQKWIDEIANTY